MKITQHAPHAGLVLRLRVPNTGAMVELSTKFGASPGEAVDLIAFARRQQARRRGPELPRRQPEHELRELRPGAATWPPASSRRPETRGFELNLLDIGGGFPAHYDDTVPPFRSWPRRSTPSSTACSRKHDRDPRRAGPVPGRHRRHRRRQDHRQGRPRRQALLLHQRRRLSHLHRRDLRPLPVPAEELQEGPDADLLRLRPHLRRARHDHPGRGAARPGARATWSTHRTSAPTPRPAARTSTASRRRRSCM